MELSQPQNASRLGASRCVQFPSSEAYDCDEDDEYGYDYDYDEDYDSEDYDSEA